MIRGSYSTKQKDIILNMIKKIKHEFTIKELYNELNKTVGLTTIYRVVDKLVLDGLVSKSIKNNNTTTYQYLEKCVEDNHFYLKCDRCGNIIHVDCDCIKDLSSHILKHHQFIINNEQIIITGVCQNCVKK